MLASVPSGFRTWTDRQLLTLLVSKKSSKLKEPVGLYLTFGSAQLPKLSNSLENLNCSSNPLNELPNLPDSLILLKCHYTLLRNLPKLPDNIFLSKTKEKYVCIKDALTNINLGVNVF